MAGMHPNLHLQPLFDVIITICRRHILQEILSPIFILIVPAFVPCSLIIVSSYLAKGIMTSLMVVIDEI